MRVKSWELSPARPRMRGRIVSRGEAGSETDRTCRTKRWSDRAGRDPRASLRSEERLTREGGRRYAHEAHRGIERERRRSCTSDAKEDSLYAREGAERAGDRGAAALDGEVGV
jgi:hypothetical protein